MLKVRIHTAHWLLHRVPKKEEKAAETKNESLNFGVNWCNARRRQPRSWTDPELHLVLFYKKRIIREKMYVFCLIWDSLAVLHSYMEVPAVFNAWRRHTRSWTDLELHSVETVLFYKKWFYMGRAVASGGGALASQFLAKNLTLSQPGG